LLGHAYEMANRSHACLRFHADRLPFVPGARQYADLWLFPGGTCNNERAYSHAVRFAPNIPAELQQLLYTPETSGGLLVPVPPDRIDRLLSLFAEAEHPCWVVGEVVDGADAGVEIL